MVPASTCLTPREAEVLALIAQGYQYAQVAERLTISPHTVDSYTRMIRLKLGVPNTWQAVVLLFTASSASQNHVQT